MKKIKLTKAKATVEENEVNEMPAPNHASKKIELIPHASKKIELRKDKATQEENEVNKLPAPNHKKADRPKPSTPQASPKDWPEKQAKRIKLTPYTKKKATQKENEVNELPAPNHNKKKIRLTPHASS